MGEISKVRSPPVKIETRLFFYLLSSTLEQKSFFESYLDQKVSISKALTIHEGPKRLEGCPKNPVVLKKMTPSLHQEHISISSTPIKIKH